MSVLATGELQTMANLAGTVEVGEMARRKEARGLLLPTAIFTRWRRDWISASVRIVLMG